MQGGEPDQQALFVAPESRRTARAPDVFLFNPYAEGFIAQGRAFTPAKHQAQLAQDLASLPQFLAQRGDIVLVPNRPATAFLEGLGKAGFPIPEFVELRDGRIDHASGLEGRGFGRLRPWAWGPDSVKLLEPLFARVRGEVQTVAGCFNDAIASLYSKAWSAGFLSEVLEHFRGRPEASWLCPAENVAGVADTLDGALKAIAAIRSRGHHRVVVKHDLGLAGHHAIRLWEPELLPDQERWMARSLAEGRRLVVEPWLDRQLDFSVQLEMEPSGLRLCGYTGLVNDRRGQYLANWAEVVFARCLPERTAALICPGQDTSGRLRDLYQGIFGLLETELARVGFPGPVSIDSLVFRLPDGQCRLKPVVEINPRYTMGRLTLELMKYTCRGSSGLFRLVSRAQARAEGYSDLCAYAGALAERLPLRMEGEPVPKVRQGAICLNDPSQAQVCLAIFEVGAHPGFPGSLCG